MRNNAYAIAITEENIKGVIRSEAGLAFDEEVALEWLEEYGHGWFLRDEGSPFDCQFFADEVFNQLYSFTTLLDYRSLIRQVEAK